MNYKKGFTLIEIMLVLAIIGILAGVVFVMIGNSDDTKIKSNLSTAKSILPFAQECLFKEANLTLSLPANKTGAEKDDPICANSISKWPTLSVEDCEYEVSGADYGIKCSWTTKRISCKAGSGSCEVL